MYHILNEPPASVKCWKHWKLCILPAVYDVHNKHQFFLRNGAVVLNYPTRLFETLVTSYKSYYARPLECGRNCTATTSVQKTKHVRKIQSIARLCPYSYPHVLYTTVHYCACTTAIMQTPAKTVNRRTMTLLLQAFSCCFHIRNSRTVVCYALLKSTKQGERLLELRHD
jgi:hypothetical protein